MSPRLIPTRRPARPRLLPLLLAAAMAVPLLALAAPARAQFGEMAGFSKVMSGYYLRRDLRFFAEQLELDDDQTAILESLFFDYEDAVRASRDRMMDRIEGIRDELEGIDPNDKEALLALVFEPFEQKAVEWQQQREEFLENLRVFLNDRQQQRWDEFRRALRREKELPGGLLSAESVDLHDVIRFAEIPPNVASAAAGALTGWELELDDALAEREAREAELRVAQMRAMRMGENSAPLEMVDGVLAASVRVRNVNELAAEEVAEALPAPFGDQFRDRFRREAFPRVYRATAAERILEAAPGIDGLSADVLEAIAVISAQYRAELGPINRALVEATRAFEPLEQRYRAESFAARRDGGGASGVRRPDDPTRVHHQARRDLDERTMDDLQALLTRQQFLSLPGASRFVARSPESSGLGAEMPERERAARRKAKEAGDGRRGPGSSGGRGGGR